MLSRRGARPGPADPARNTNFAEGSPFLLLPHSFPNFEALIVQYYNLKTPIICFVLKRKIQLFFFLAVLQGTSFSWKPTAMSTQAKVNGQVKRGISTIPAQSRNPSPLRKILPLLCWGAFEGTLPLSRGRLGPAIQGQQPSQRSATSQALGYLL